MRVQGGNNGRWITQYLPHDWDCLWDTQSGLRTMAITQLNAVHIQTTWLAGTGMIRLHRHPN